MADYELPSEVRRLIDEVVASMDHVDVLRVVAAEPDVAVPSATIAERLKIDERVAAAVSRELTAAGLLVVSGAGVSLSPAGRVRASIAELLNAYNTRPVTLIRAIYARPKPLKAFADAFRIRREE